MRPYAVSMHSSGSQWATVLFGSGIWVLLGELWISWSRVASSSQPPHVPKMPLYLVRVRVSVSVRVRVRVRGRGEGKGEGQGQGEGEGQGQG